MYIYWNAFTFSPVDGYLGFRFFQFVLLLLLYINIYISPEALCKTMSFGYLSRGRVIGSNDMHVLDHLQATLPGSAPTFPPLVCVSTAPHSCHHLVLLDCLFSINGQG